MQFQEVPDSISMSLARLSAACPRAKLPPGTMAILREKMLPYPQAVIERAVKALEESTQGFGRNPVAEMVAALKLAAQGADSGDDASSTLRMAEIRFSELSRPRRLAYTHAVDVLHAAECLRRNVSLPPALANLQINQEMLAHDVQIAQNGEKVRYNAHQVLNPIECPAGVRRELHERKGR